MTDQEHRQIGLALGYPPCCVEAWITTTPQGKPIAMIRGSVTLGPRLTRPEGLPDGWSPDLLTSDPWIKFVPCRNCIGRPGWIGWEHTDPERAREADRIWPATLA
jgi:hypothetical protein